MDKRSFLKKSAILTIGGALAGSSVGLKAAGSLAGLNNRADEDYQLPELPYTYDALEPYIDTRTMEIHHSKHHAGYTAKFNAALDEYGLKGQNIMELFNHVSQQPLAIRNNGGGYYNHTLFWNSMSPKGGGKPRGDLLKAIEKSFGTFDGFREKFSSAAATRLQSSPARPA